MTFFPSITLNLNYPVKLEKLKFQEFTYFAVKSKKTMFFSGQVNPNFYDKIIESNNYLRDACDQLISTTKKIGTMFLFDREYFDEFDFDLETYVAVRHKVLNEWRLWMLKNLSQNFGSRLYLLGSDFKKFDFGEAVILNSKFSASEMYREAKLNLDLGSQSGPEYLYPRTLEIQKYNYSSVCCFIRDKPDHKLGFKFWQNLDDLEDLLEG
jgi:hypothetical protein